MFKEIFKYYKRKSPPPDLIKVVDFTSRNLDFSKVKSKTLFDDVTITTTEEMGLVPLSDWKMYELNSHPGLLFIVNPFTSIGQKVWIAKALSVYPRPPNRLNLHAHNDLTTEEDWWHICQTDETRKQILYKRLRWATLGYHHNWDTKVYSEDEKNEFPSDLKALSQLVVKVACNIDLEPQAAIVNYYHIGSTLSGHTDHSEPNQNAPLVSFSFGQDALFIIGGESLEDECETILIKSGDIMIMSGKSRQCYHGIPLIKQSPEKPWVEEHDINSSHQSWAPYEHYISTSRININVRQVLHSGCQTLIPS